MKKITLTLSILALFGSLQSLWAFDLAGAASALGGGSTQEKADTSLISTLTSQLGISSSQAIGGTAALMNEAKGNMSAEDYKTVTNALPGVSGNSNASALGSLSGMASSSVGEIFKSLGMDSAMVDQFTPVILDYALKEGGPMVMNLLKDAF